MAVNISFKLRDPQKQVVPSRQVETPIIMMVNFGYYELSANGTKLYKPLKYSTGQKIIPDHWLGSRAKQSRKLGYDSLNTNLDNLEKFAKDSVTELTNSGEVPNPDNVKYRIDKKAGRNVMCKSRCNNLNEYIDVFIKDSESGARLTDKKTRYKAGTIKNFKGFKVQFDDFQLQKRKKLDFDAITLDFYDRFVEFFTEKKYSPNTIGRHIKNLKTIMRYARDEGYHNNSEIDRRKFKVLREDVDNIYLTEPEIKLLYEMDLSDKPHWELARDVFLIGCYTAQRFSDYSTIRKEQIQDLENGRKVIRLTQQKTGEPVVIPVRHELEVLLKKYDWTVPKIWEQKLNKYIKEVGGAVKINMKVPIEQYKGGLKVKSTVPKCDLIKTHTARRSGCTNMYLAGISPLDIMKISGHKTEREFLKYIKVTKEETAKNLITHPYFSNPVLKKA